MSNQESLYIIYNRARKTKNVLENHTDLRNIFIAAECLLYLYDLLHEQRKNTISRTSQFFDARIFAEVGVLSCRTSFKQIITVSSPVEFF